MATDWIEKRTSLRRLFRRSDTGRWSADESFHENWDERTAQLATFVRPGERVLEFGSGMLALRELLPADAVHIATDLVSRGPGTYICDLNHRTLPELPDADVAFFSGVLEYVNNLPRSLARVSERVPALICSYATVEANPERRRFHGWVNDYSEDDLVRVIESLGYSCGHREDWKRQVLFRFDRR
ncbi:MAG: hypothetical protein ACI81L_003663 [Verrucomicrobiales bacterium]|jgi:hypothetical protein